MAAGATPLRDDQVFERRAAIWTTPTTTPVARLRADLVVDHSVQCDCDGVFDRMEGSMIFATVNTSPVAPPAVPPASTT